MKKIVVSALAVLLVLTSAGQFQRNPTKFDFVNGIRVGTVLGIPRDTLATADSGSLAYVNSVLYIKSGHWKQAIPSAYNPSAGFGVHITGTYPNHVYTIDSLPGTGFATRDRLQKLTDSLLALTPPFNPTSPYGIIITGTNPNKVFTPDTLASGLATRLRVQKIVDSLEALHPRVKSIGRIYAVNTWSTLGDFTNQSSGGTASSGNIDFTGGANTYVKTLDISMVNGLAKWEVSGVFVAGTPGGTSYGFGIGHRSVNNSSPYYTQFVCRFDMSTGGDAGKILIDAGNSTYTNVAKSSALSFSTADKILLTVTRTDNIVTATAKNLTTLAASVSVSYAFNYITAPYPANTGTFSVYNFGGSFTLDSLGVSSIEPAHPGTMFLGDSKTEGGQVTDISKRFVTQFNEKYGTSVANEGQGDKTAEILKLLPEVTGFVKPAQVILAIGSNDIRTGVSSGTWQANYQSIVDGLHSAGIRVYHMTPIPESSLNQTALYNYIISTYSPDSIVNVTTPLNECADCLYSGGVHPNDKGHDIIYNAIAKASLPNADKLNKDQGIRNQFGYSSTPQPFKFNISDTAKARTLYATGEANFLDSALRVVTGNDYFSSPTIRTSAGKLLYIKSMGNHIVFRGGNGTGDRPIFQLETESGVEQTQYELRSFNNNAIRTNAPFYIYTTGPTGFNGDMHLKTGVNFSDVTAQGGNFDIYLEPARYLKANPFAVGAATDSIVVYRPSDSTFRMIDAGRISTGGGGGSTSPAGNNHNIQINNNGVFGAAGSDSLTWSDGLKVKGPISVTDALTNPNVFTNKPAFNFGGAIIQNQSTTNGMFTQNMYYTGSTLTRVVTGPAGYVGISNGAVHLGAIISGTGTFGQSENMKMQYSGSWGIGVMSNPALNNFTGSVMRGTASGWLTLAGSADATSTLDVKGSVAYGYRAITANRTLDGTDQTVECTSGSFTVTYPTAAGITGRLYLVKNSGAGTITLATTSGQTLDGASPPTLGPGEWIATQSNNANWMIVGRTSASTVTGSSITGTSSNLTVTTESIIEVTGGTPTLTFPSAADIVGRVITVINSGSGDTTIESINSEVIGNSGSATTLDLPAGATISLISNGTAWRVR